MDKQNLMPQVAQPVNRITTGLLPVELAELKEEALQQHDCEGEDAGCASAFPPITPICQPFCSYDGDDAE